MEVAAFQISSVSNFYCKSAKLYVEILMTLIPVSV